jgi:hypothetical protein
MIADEPPLDGLLTTALARLQAEMQAAAPFLAGQVSAWMKALARTPSPEDYFRNPLSFPLLLLPWWLEQTIRPQPDVAFQADLVFSTVNGYYYIRLLDNVMDGHPVTSGAGVGVELTLLPAAAFFHTQFQAAYQRHFGPAHPFWDDFSRLWFRSADVTAQDASLSEVSLEAFRRYAGQKVCAVKIPLAAVCHRYDRVDRLEAWSRFVDALGAWHQLCNDVFDCSKDLRHGTGTYFLSQAERRKAAGESAAGWVVREGFDWGIATLHAWLAEARGLARPLGSPQLLAYLDGREAMLRRQQAEVGEGLRRLADLAAVMR